MLLLTSVATTNPTIFTFFKSLILVLFIISLFFLYCFSIIPFSFYVGLVIIGFFGIDNRNIGFLLLVLVLFPLIYWISAFESKSINFNSLLITLFILLLSCFLIHSLLLFFLFFEYLIILLFFILLIFIPSFYRMRSAFWFFLFTIFGNFLFIFSLFIMISSNFLFCLISIFPFFIKVPSFPFFYWLPEVHCEVNSTIPLFLAGLLLKLSIYGIMRFILSSFFLSLRFLSSFIICFTLIGIIVASFSCFRYFDLKKIIAFSSILHLNLSLVSILSLNCSGLLSGILISISHGFTSSSLFLLCGLLINKTYSRYCDSFFFMNTQLRGLLICFLLSNLSFPGSLNLVGEILPFIAILSIDDVFGLLFLFCSFWNTFFWFLLFNRKLPYPSCFSLSHCNFLLLIWFLFLLYVSGIYYLLFDLKKLIVK